MTHRAPRPLLWDIYEEHLDEATFLWARWEHALGAANYTLRDVLDGPEARLLAHLDGLVLGGKPVAEQLLLPALVTDEPDRAAAAAWALLQAEHGEDHQDAVLDAWKHAERAVSAAIAHALRVSPRIDLSRVARCWTAAAPEIRTSAFELMSWREPGWASQHLPAALRAEQGAMVATGLRMLRRSRDRALIGLAQEALAREATTDAIVTGVVLGLEQAWDACRRVELVADDVCRLPLALLATSTSEADRDILRNAATHSAAQLHALWALGFLADGRAADISVEAMANEKLAKVAGEAFTAITGIALDRALVCSGETRGPSDEEVSDDDKPPSVHSEHHLPQPDAAAVARVWQRERGRYTSGSRFCAGERRTPTAVCAALSTAPMWRREALWIELARSGFPAPTVDLQTWAYEQTRALRATS